VSPSIVKTVKLSGPLSILAATRGGHLKQLASTTR